MSTLDPARQSVPRAAAAPFAISARSLFCVIASAFWVNDTDAQNDTNAEPAGEVVASSTFRDFLRNCRSLAFLCHSERSEESRILFSAGERTLNRDSSARVEKDPGFFASLRMTQRQGAKRTKIRGDRHKDKRPRANSEKPSSSQKVPGFFASLRNDTRKLSEMASSAFSRFPSLGAGVTPAEGSVKPTAGFTYNGAPSLGSAPGAAFTPWAGSVNLVG